MNLPTRRLSALSYHSSVLSSQSGRKTNYGLQGFRVFIKMLELSAWRRRMPATRPWLILSALILLAARPLSAREPYDVTVESNVTMKTRDGVALSADIYRPKAEGKFPVLLERTPYDKHRM